ncbi:arginine/serine-rich protein 1 [Grus japonensis]|uniref:Arginine/serine-rich protein 1 n=1 Tax=Grus japonensis TaxID=30415 RepID=A0ABC9XSR1_GRUJA
MGVTHEAGLSPQASPLEQDPCGGSPAAWSRSALVSHGNQHRGCPAAPSGTETGYYRTTIKTEPASDSTCMEKMVVRKTEDMTDFMDDLTLSSPKKRELSLRSKRSCDRSSTRSWRSRSRTRSRSRSPLHLSEKDKRELLEIAKANAAKALGTDNIVLPASLKIVTPSKEIKKEKQEHEDAGESAEQPSRTAEDITKSGLERVTLQRSISFSPNNTMAKPVLQKPASHVVKEPVISLGREDDRKGSPYGQWVPVKKEEKNTFLNFSPKSVPFRAR